MVMKQTFPDVIAVSGKCFTHGAQKKKKRKEKTKKSKSVQNGLCSGW